MYKKRVKVVAGILLVLTFVFCLEMVSSKQVYAVSGLVKIGEYTREGVVGTIGDYTIDGKQAFCLEHTKLNAPDGTPFGSTETNSIPIKKAMYYGFSGPKEWDGFKDQREKGVVVTSLVLAFLYEGAGKYTHVEGYNDFMNYIQSMPSPPVDVVGFSKESVKAYWDKDQKIKRTENIEVVGDAGNTVSFFVPENIGVKNVTKNGSVEGGDVSLSVGDEFYFYSAGPEKINKFQSGTVGNDEKFTAFICNFGHPHQKMGRWEDTKEDDINTHIEAIWPEKGTINFQKSLEKIDGLSVKDMAGFKFTVSGNGITPQTFTTDEDGKFTAQLEAGTYSFEEVYDPGGNFKRAEPISVTATEGKPDFLSMQNTYKKGNLKIIKRNPDGDLLKGSKFVLRSGSYSGYEKEFTLDDGEIEIEGLPTGAYSLTEIEAPKGYIKNTSAIPLKIQESKLTTKKVINNPMIGRIVVYNKDDFEKKGHQKTVATGDELNSPWIYILMAGALLTIIVTGIKKRNAR